ncbi:MAG: PIN domain-containing protein [Anaerolineaceae bacterium]|nr:PIN domain-containing protein [Anaerolineaceae bacterium]
MKIADALVGVDLLSVETAPFIYYTESRPIYFDKVSAIFPRMSQGQFEILCSVITLSETLNKPIEANDQMLISAYNSLFDDTYGLTLVSVNKNIARKAAELRAKYGLKTPDAIHMATALETHCQAFLTNDMGLKRVTEIQVLVLDELEVS